MDFAKFLGEAGERKLQLRDSPLSWTELTFRTRTYQSVDFETIEATTEPPFFLTAKVIGGRNHLHIPEDAEITLDKYHPIFRRARFEFREKMIVPGNRWRVENDPIVPSRPYLRVVAAWNPQTSPGPVL